jgi:prophage DNA circulation protein
MPTPDNPGRLLTMPVTEASIAAARDVQEIERAEGIAILLANFSGIYDLKSEPEQTRKHFAQWGLIAVRGSSLGANQFRTVALAMHAAAQAAHDCEAHLEQYPAQDLLCERNAYERQHWSVISSRAVQAYLGVVGGVTTRAAQGLYAERLGHQ